MVEAAIRSGQHRSRLPVAVVASLCIIAGIAAVSAQNRIRHASGQSVTPSFEGWFENPDGTFNLVFGYFNRNFEEELEIPTGPNNKIEPGPADQGQPTHFLPERQVGVFVLVVPKDFGKKTVTWTLASRSETFSIPGYLRPEWRLEALKQPTSDAVPPVVRFDPAGGKADQGPAGPTAIMKVAFDDQPTLNAWVTGLETPGRGEAGRGNSAPPLTWSKYRGPGLVSFAVPRPRPDKTGKITTTATFSEPGEYTLLLVAGRPNTGGCCWTNAFLKVTVSPSGAK